LYADLSSRYLVFYDRRGVDGGERFAERIDRELRRCRLLIVVVDRNAADSTWVSREVKVYCDAHKQQARILPLFVEPLAPRDMPTSLRELASFHGYTHACPANASECSGAFGDISPSRPESLTIPVSQSVALVDGSFRGRRQRQQALRALGALILAFTLLATWFYWTVERSRARDAALAMAELAAGEDRVLDAEVQLAAAAERYGATDALTARYHQLRSRRSVTPIARRRLRDDWRVESVSFRGSEPRLLLRRLSDDDAQERLALVTFDQWIETLRGTVDLDPQVLWGESEAFVFSGGQLTHVQLAPKRTRQLATGLTSGVFRDASTPVELRRSGVAVVLLGRLERPPQLLHVDPESLTVRQQFSIAGDLDADRLLIWTAEEQPRVCVVTRDAGSSTVEVRFVDAFGESTGDPQTFALPLGALGFVVPKLWKAALSPDGRQLFLQVMSLRLGGVSDRDSTLHWVAIDLHTAREPLLLEPGIERLEAMPAYEDPEALYSTESGDLRGLRFRSLMVLARESQTLFSNVERWSALRSSASRTSGLRAALATNGELLLLDQGGLRLRATAVEPSNDVSTEVLSVRLDDDERILVLEHAGSDGVVVSAWKLGAPQGVERVPGERELRAALSLPPALELAPPR
jgi:hypothetical protein